MSTNNLKIIYPTIEKLKELEYSYHLSGLKKQWMRGYDIAQKTQFLLQQKNIRNSTEIALFF